MAKVEEALAGLHTGLAKAEERLDRGLAPLVQSLALEQIDIRASVEALRGLPPLVQSLTMEQLEVREKLAERREPAQAAAPAARPAPIAAPQLVVCPVLCTPAAGEKEVEGEHLKAASAAVKDLEDLERQLRQDLGKRLGAVEQADEYLFSELQAMRDCTKGMERDVKQLRADLQQGLEQKPGEREEAAAAPPPKHSAGGPDAWLPWGEGLPASLPYSGKVVVDFRAASGRRGGGGKRSGAEAGSAEGLAPFARGPPLRPLERTPGCQSLPLLPPLR